MILHPLLFRLALFALCLATCASCASRPRSPYPPPDTLRMAEPQRHEFIHLFLQGRWCEAGGLFARSVEGYLMQDNFCLAAQNHIIAWKLKNYVGLDDDDNLEQARFLLQTGQDCPGVVLPAMSAEEDLYEKLPEKDRAYRALLQAGDFETLAARLHAERDELYASVYGRKAARAALQAGDKALAREFIEQTRALDARQGWIVFLIQDWRFLCDLEPDKAQQADIRQRIELLQDMIQPCPF